jgi:hypothetical protein
MIFISVSVDFFNWIFFLIEKISNRNSLYRVLIKNLKLQKLQT